MGNSIKPLPENEKLLELFLEQGNRVIDYLELILRAQRYRADHIRMASTDLRAVAPRLAMLHSLKNKLEEHTALDGPDCRELAEHLESEAMERFLQLQNAARHRLSAVTRSQPMTQEHFGQAGEALAQVVDSQVGILDLFKSLRRQIIAKLSDLARSKTKIGADNNPDKRGKKSAGRPLSLPRNVDVIRLAKEIQRSQQFGLSKAQTALDFTNGDKKRADTLLRGLRNHKYLLNPGVDH